MIYSMTAYAREEVKGDWGTAVWELRSVNQRYLETYFRLPEQFRSLEIPLRERFRKHLQRGKVECNLRFTPGNASGTDLKINETLALAVLRGAEWIQSQGANASVSPLDVLRWPGVISTEENRSEEHTSELQSRPHLVCRLLLEKKKNELSCLLPLLYITSTFARMSAVIS